MRVLFIISEEEEGEGEGEEEAMKEMSSYVGWARRMIIYHKQTRLFIKANTTSTTTYFLSQFTYLLILSLTHHSLHLYKHKHARARAAPAFSSTRNQNIRVRYLVHSSY